MFGFIISEDQILLVLNVFIPKYFIKIILLVAKNENGMDQHYMYSFFTARKNIASSTKCRISVN